MFLSTDLLINRQDGHRDPRAVANLGGGGTAGLDIPPLEGVVHQLFQANLALSTHRAYQAGKNRYLNFCSRMEATPLPASEKLLCFFMAFLKQEGLRHQTAKAYLLAVRYLQISSGMGDPNKLEMPRLELVVRGFKMLQGAASEDTALHYPRYPSENPQQLEGGRYRVGYHHVVGCLVSVSMASYK